MGKAKDLQQRKRRKATAAELAAREAKREAAKDKQRKQHQAAAAAAQARLFSGHGGASNSSAAHANEGADDEAAEQQVVADNDVRGVPAPRQEAADQRHAGPPDQRTADDHDDDGGGGGEAGGADAAAAAAAEHVPRREQRADDVEAELDVEEVHRSNGMRPRRRRSAAVIGRVRVWALGGRRTSARRAAATWTMAKRESALALRRAGQVRVVLCARSVGRVRISVPRRCTSACTYVKSMARVGVGIMTYVLVNGREMVTVRAATCMPHARSTVMLDA